MAVLLHPLLVGPCRRTGSTGDDVAPPAVRRLLEAARWSSSAWNRQPWRFVIGRGGDETFQVLCAALTPGNRTRGRTATALLLAAVRVQDDNGATMSGAEYELGLAVARLTVQAHAAGVEVRQFGGFDRGVVRAALRIPVSFDLIVVLGLHPPNVTARRLREPRRLSLPELVYSGRWGVPADLGAPDSDLT